MKLIAKTHYTLNAVGYVLYFSVLAFLLAAMLTRHNQAIWHDAGSHLSNFALSALLLFISGAVNMLNRPSKGYILTCAGFLIVANFAIESFTSTLNIKDFTDAFYGCGGVFVSFGLLFILQKYGIRRSGN